MPRRATARAPEDALATRLRALLRKGCVQAEDINALCSQREREDHTGETDALGTVGDHQDRGAGLRLKLELERRPAIRLIDRVLPEP